VKAIFPSIRTLIFPGFTPGKIPRRDDNPTPLFTKGWEYYRWSNLDHFRHREDHDAKSNNLGKAERQFYEPGDHPPGKDAPRCQIARMWYQPASNANSLMPPPKLTINNQPSSQYE